MTKESLPNFLNLFLFFYLVFNSFPVPPKTGSIVGPEYACKAETGKKVKKEVIPGYR